MFLSDDLDNLTSGINKSLRFFTFCKAMQSTFVYAIKFQFLGVKFWWSAMLLISQFFHKSRIWNCNYANAITNVLFF